MKFLVSGIAQLVPFKFCARVKYLKIRFSPENISELYNLKYNFAHRINLVDVSKISKDF